MKPLPYVRAGIAAVLLFVAAACGSDGSTGSTGGGTTTPGAPSAIAVVTSPTASVSAGAGAGTFSVKVTDAKAVGVANLTVTFTVTGSATVAPATVTTDASGIASTTVTAGTTSGAVVVRATASGISSTVTANIAVTAAVAAKVVNTPKTLRLVSLGDTARVTATAQDQYGNTAGAGAITYSAVDATLVSVDQAGLVRAIKQGGSTFVIASSNGKADTTIVTVLAAGQSACTGFATASAMNVGDVQTLSGTQYGCFSGTAAGAEFAIVAFNSSTDASNFANTSITGQGLATAPTTARVPESNIAALRSASGSTSLALDEDFHLQLLRRANTLHAGIIGRSRAARSSSVLRSVAGTDGASLQSAAIGTIPSSVKVGDVLLLNVSANDCTSPTYHGVRVQAVGTRSVVLADTLNPTGGFVSADYQRFAANFDTLVYPLDVGNFGAPSDIDANGRVAIIFTRAVNELVDANSGYFVGGFFNPRDIYPKKGATAADDCTGSNEGEMFYLVAPAPAGINGVTHTTGFVDSLSTGIIAHEFQHLINAERRFYVNPTAPAFEDIWLNEGLSHIAEELLYYRESGFTPRQNLNDSTVRILNRPVYGFFKSDAASNFSRFLAYLRAPASNSPIANDDELATRGATWAYLRYSVDRLGGTESTIWQKMDNSTSSGLGTLQQAFGTDPKPFFRDWAVANFTDDFGITTDPKYQHLSWNFRNILTTTFLNIPTYPLPLTLLANNVKNDFAIRGTSASYARFAVPAGSSSLITFSSGGGVPAAALQFLVVRTK